MSDFNFEEFAKMSEGFSRLPVVIGIAMSPRAKALVERQATPIHDALPFHYSSIMGIPYIVDPRLSDTSKIYYDVEKWNERCKEQRKWDENPILESTS